MAMRWNSRSAGLVACFVFPIVAGCSGKERPFATEAPPSAPSSTEVTEPGPTSPSEGAPGGAAEGVAGAGEPAIQAIAGIDMSNASAAPTASPDALPVADAGVSSSCVLGTTEACGPGAEVGRCAFGARTCTESGWSECVGAVLAGARDCTSAEDNDCDGLPDNTSDDVCRCSIGAVEPCDEHAGLDGRGPCRAGSRTCVAGEGNLASDWGACTGAVAPAQVDSCAIAGNDDNCNGTPNDGCTCVEGQTIPCGPDTDNGLCERGTSTCVGGAFSECQGARFPAPRDCRSPDDNDCDGRPDNTVDSICTCVIGDTQICGAHPGLDGNGPCRAGQQACEAGLNNATSRFGACSGVVNPLPSDSCARLGDDSDCDGVANGTCDCIAGQGNAQCSQDPAAPVCNGLGQCVACQADGDCALVSGGRNSCQRGLCSLPPVCGDGITNGNEVCDSGNSGSTELGDCNPECNGFYVRKRLLPSVAEHSTDLGGISGADSICTADFGAGWKALLVGGGRRATITPFVGDGQQDWVLHRYTYYFNDLNELVWRTDGVPLLGASGARKQPLIAPMFDPKGRYPWSGYNTDWTTVPDGTCEGWTSTDRTQFGNFVTQNLEDSLGERCDPAPFNFVLCVEQ